MEYIKYFFCPHCGKQLLNQNEFVNCDNVNEFFCDDCNLVYVIEGKEIIEE